MKEDKPKTDFKIPKITNYEELEIVLDSLSNQGFGSFGRSWEHHNNKIDSLIRNANTLNLNIPDSLTKDLRNKKDYNDVELEAKKYFSSFNSDDKIYEYINNYFSIKYDDKSKAPGSNNDRINEVIEWVNFRIKYNLNDKDFKNFEHQYTNTYIYNLDKKTIKINFSDESTFRSFYKLIYEEECAPFDKHSNSFGEWYNLGKIEIKQFQNGTVTLRGDLSKLKNYYYKYLTQKQIYNSNYVVYYKNKTQIIRPNK